MADRYFGDIGSTFMFGKYRGQLLCDVISGNPGYVFWCIKNIPEFCFGACAVEQISEIYPAFPKLLLQEAAERASDDCDYCDMYDEYIEEEGNFEESPSYDRYSGSYAQDEMGYSDEAIDTIFDGDPDAYWNID